MNKPNQQPGWCRRRAPSLVGWLCWVSVLVLVALGGRVAGRGVLAPPALTDPGSWGSWARARAPVEAAFAVLGLLVVVMAWYLLAVTLLGAAAHLWGSRRLVSVVDVLTLPVVRRSLHAALGIGLVGSTMAGVAAGGGAVHREGRSVAIAGLVPAVAVAEPDQEPGATTDGGEASGAEPPVMHLLPDEAADGDAGSVAATPSSQPTEAEWEVQPGDHLWSVAVRALQDAGTDGQGDDQVAAYWQRLIEANGDRLADRANPDLIFPGQVLVLPAPHPT